LSGAPDSKEINNAELGVFYESVQIVKWTSLTEKFKAMDGPNRSIRLIMGYLNSLGINNIEDLSQGAAREFRIITRADAFLPEKMISPFISSHKTKPRLKKIKRYGIEFTIK